jgi:glycosyltransferase involved in cell wall biosynthesis
MSAGTPASGERIRAILVSNFCPHYRVRTYETLARKMDVRCLFVSRGEEDYWDPQRGVQRGDFPHEYLEGLHLTSRLRVTPGLVSRLWRSDAEVIFMALADRFSVPVGYGLARLRRKSFVLWTGLWQHPRTRFHRLTFPLLRHIYTHADAVLVYGTHVRDYLIGLGVRPDRIFVADHAVDNAVYDRPVPAEARARLRAELGAAERKLVLYVGRLTESKGLSDLVQAAAAVADLKPQLVLVGDGRLRGELEAQAAALGVPARLVPHVAPAELYPYYAAADVLVLPSVTTPAGKEPWGLVVNEAMNQATPVVASTAVGAAAGGLVRDGETGLVFPEGDVSALAGALRRVLSDGALAQRLGRAGREAVSRHTNERMVAAFVAAAGRARGGDAL